MSDLYIVSQNEKKLLMEHRNNHPEKDMDIMLDSELKEAILGTINPSAISYLVRLGFSFSNAKKIVDMTLPLKDIEFKIPLVKQDGTSTTYELKNLYNEFLNLKFVNKNKYINLYLKNKNIYLSPTTNNSEINWLLRDYKDNIKVLNIDSNVESRTLYVSKTLDESCFLLFTLIAKKHQEGVELKNIKIADSSNDFIELLKSYNRFYEYPFVFSDEIKKNKLVAYEKFIESLKEKSLKESLEELSEEDLIKEFINIYIETKDFLSDAEIIDYIKEYAENKIKIKTSGVIEFVDKYYIAKEGEVLFVPNFVSSCYPSPVGDDTYPGDEEFAEAHLLTSKEKNQIEKIKFKEMYVSNGKVVFLSQKKYKKVEFLESSFLKEYAFNIIEQGKNDSYPIQIYSNKRIKNLKLSISQDYERFYGIENQYKDQLNEVQEYNTYSPVFKKFDSFEKIKRNSVSFTLLNSYIECPFKYYLANELKLDKFEDNEVTRKGKVYHKYMENMTNGIDESIDYYLNMIDDPREKILVEKGFESVKKSYELHKNFVEESHFNKVLPENGFTVDVDGITLYGKVDCLLLNDQYKYAAIIDYKTSNKSFNKNLIDEGESLQLPIYLLLLSKYKDDYTPIGAYISNLSSSEYLRKGSEDDFKISGITRADYLPFINPKKYIKGLKMQDESYVLNANTGSEDDFKLLIKTAEKTVINVVNSIENGDFPITPLNKKKTDACKYCTFKDICYKDNLDDLEGDEENED